MEKDEPVQRELFYWAVLFAKRLYRTKFGLYGADLCGVIGLLLAQTMLEDMGWDVEVPEAEPRRKWWQIWRA